MKNCFIFCIIIIILPTTLITASTNVIACKDILACGDATAGDYNLLLKVRDPSRQGFQTLCIIPEGYEYSYRHPWKGTPMDFAVLHKFIGVATINDTPPNIVKMGMSFSDSGLGFGDADTGSGWRNPTKFAWDDFDWMRYACEKADDEDDAKNLLTIDIVDTLHASRISENLFVVGPQKGYVIEADAFRYKIKEVIDDCIVMSTYPKELWKTQYLRKLPISPTFDTVKNSYVEKGDLLRLNSTSGIRILEVGKDWITIIKIPLFKIGYDGLTINKPVKINLGDRKTVGGFSVTLLGIEGTEAFISLCYKYKYWEDKMMSYIDEKKGSITIKDMMNWSRLHEDDLDGLRAMCEENVTYESSMIFKIPNTNYEKISSGWFSANHPCSTIYIPVHICDVDIFDPYKNGDAAQISLELLKYYGHDNLTSHFTKAEDVFLYETDSREQKACEMILDNIEVFDFLTFVDMGIQKQAWLTELLWIDLLNFTNDFNKLKIQDVIAGIWDTNYTISLEKMETALITLNDIPQTENFKEKISEIISSISELTFY